MNTSSSNRDADLRPAVAYYLLTAHSFLEDLRRGRARLFPGHITVRGQFVPKVFVSCEELIGIGRTALGGVRRLDVQLHGPVTVRPGLIWYEPAADTEAAMDLFRAHEKLNRLIQQRVVVSRDEVPPQHLGQFFRPHFTVTLDSFDADNAVWPEIVTMEVDGWGLFEYSATADSAVSTLHIEPLIAPDKESTFARAGRGERSTAMTILKKT